MSRLTERLALSLLRRVDPEKAHKLALIALKAGVAASPSRRVYPRLQCRFAGLDLQNPVGLAAGFDKNAEAIRPLISAGFGFVEVGGVTPRPQPGNAQPRLFRLSEDRAVINRFGFNNDGMDVVAARLSNRPKHGVIGINLGANKDSEDKAGDFAAVLTRCGAFVDFATVNVSSPNTEKLRDLQGPEALRRVLSLTQEANQALPRPVPLLVKIAPDLNVADLDAIVTEAEAAELAGIVATNTTLDRPDTLRSKHKGEAGGLSGAPLFEKSTEVLRQLAARTVLPLVGVGGISTGEEAAEKFAAGAGAVQLYSALAYQGLSLLPQLLSDLDQQLAARDITLESALVPALKA